MPRFEKVYCSQCGGEFGPRDSGYSHCEDHRANNVQSQAAESDVVDLVTEDREEKSTRFRCGNYVAYAELFERTGRWYVRRVGSFSSAVGSRTSAESVASEWVSSQNRMFNETTELSRLRQRVAELEDSPRMSAADAEVIRGALEVAKEFCGGLDTDSTKSWLDDLESMKNKLDTAMALPVLNTITKGVERA